MKMTLSSAKHVEAAHWKKFLPLPLLPLLLRDRGGKPAAGEKSAAINHLVRQVDPVRETNNKQRQGVAMPEITVHHRGDMQFETQIGNHRLIIDVPPEMKGKDRGLTPPQLFIASLASCIAVFAASYCNNAGINTEGLSVALSFDKLIEPPRLGSFKAVIKIPNGEVGNKESAVIRAAKHCPIHETIRVSPEVEITLEK